MEERKDSVTVIVSQDAPDALNDFRPGTPFYLAFASLSVIVLAAAIDATSLSVALPVQPSQSPSRTPS